LDGADEALAVVQIEKAVEFRERGDRFQEFLKLAA
jgi:hypothetical protein